MIGTMDKAKKDWRDWLKAKGLRATNPEAHFLAFCRTWAKSRNRPVPKGDGHRPQLSLRDRLAKV